jgi:phosphoenolpyruvate carboxykinase (ATP)
MATLELGDQHLNAAAAAWNLNTAALYEAAVARGEARIAAGGALVVETGPHTGRSPQDKFIVRDAQTEDTIWWHNNRPMSRAHFDLLLQDFAAHASGRALYVQELFAGADPACRLPVRMICEYAWHALFIRNLLFAATDGASFVPRFTVIDLPSFKADPARHGTRSETVIAIDLARGLVLIGGTQYGGEMKKAVFTVLNYLLPEQGIMPMHCSANMTRDGKSAIFFGLSGTGKTTLSADPARILIGDDEHGWGPHGIFNFEAGCYAKVIKLSAEAEPAIHATTQRWGTVLENVAMDPVSREIDFDDGTRTENTRAAYPIHFIANASRHGMAATPRNIVMLTADAFGVLPPIAKLTPAQAMYHFLSGYTAKVAGTERGVSEPQATFSTCFGAPFIPRHPGVYGDLLKELIAKHKVTCWLVNTGWTGGPYGTGHRMPIADTRRLLAAALDGQLAQAAMRTDPNFGFAVPTRVEGVDSTMLNPRETWTDARAYDAQAARLVDMFVKNFAAFEAHVSREVRAASPAVRLAAE